MNRPSLCRYDFIPALMQTDDTNLGGANVDPMKHNYYKKLMKLHAQGKLPTVGLHEVDICHDDWCRVYRGGYCNCEPDIRVRQQPGLGAEHRKTDTQAVRVAGSITEEVRPLEPPPCPHCGCKQFIMWQGADDPTRQAISCDGCGAVLSSTHPLDPEDRPKRRP